MQSKTHARQSKREGETFWQRAARVQREAEAVDVEDVAYTGNELGDPEPFMIFVTSLSFEARRMYVLYERKYVHYTQVVQVVDVAEHEEWRAGEYVGIADFMCDLELDMNLLQYAIVQEIAFVSGSVNVTFCKNFQVYIDPAEDGEAYEQERAAPYDDHLEQMPTKGAVH